LKSIAGLRKIEVKEQEVKSMCKKCGCGKGGKKK